MPGEKVPSHAKSSSERAVGDRETRGLEAANEGAWEGPGEEPRDVHKAGQGTVGRSLGGANTGRYGAAPGEVESNRERKPRGSDK